MKRIAIIVWALSAASMVPAWAQRAPMNGPLTGSIRYEFRYEDVLANQTLSTTRFHVPSLFLLKKGAIVSPNLLMYTLSTSITGSFQSTLAPLSSSHGEQIHWNEYDINLYALQSSPLKFQFSMREYTDKTTYTYPAVSVRSRMRNHQDVFGLEVDRVAALPRLTFTYIRNRAWSLEGASFDQRSDQYNFAAFSRNGEEGYASLVGSYSDFREPSVGFSERILTVNFDGSRSLAEGHSVTVGSEFDRYDFYSSLTGGIAYSGRVSPSLGLNTGVSGQSASGGTYSYTSLGFNQGVRLDLDRHFRLGLRGSASRGTTVTGLSLAPKRIPNDRWEGGADLNHTRGLGRVSVTNALAFTYGRINYLEQYPYHSFVFSNAAATTVGTFGVNGTYVFSLHETKSALAWRSYENNATLGASGLLPAAIHSQTSADYRSIWYSGFAATPPGLSALKLSEVLSRSFTGGLPFTIRVRGSVQFHYRGIRGKTYSFGASFQSPRFFVTGLTASYIFSRDYDPFYRILTINHDASFVYRWRLLTFQLGLFQRSEFSRIRQVRFTVERAL